MIIKVKLININQSKISQGNSIKVNKAYFTIKAYTLFKNKIAKILRVIIFEKIAKKR
jgi:hypothetical protein